MVTALPKGELPAVVSYPLFAAWMAAICGYLLAVWVVLAIAEAFESERRALFPRPRKGA